MKALLLAAGYGTRLGTLTKDLPKCLMNVGDETMLDHWLYKLDALGVSEFIINTHYLAKHVEEFVSLHPLKDKIFLSYEPKLLGTAGTLFAHKNFLRSDISFIVHVDNYCEDKLDGFLNSHKNCPSKIVLSMLTFITEDPSKCGVVELDSHGRLISFSEKQPTSKSHIANGAVYIISEDFFKEFSLSTFPPGYDISLDIIPHLLGKINCYPSKGYFADIGTKEKLQESIKWKHSFSKKTEYFRNK